MTKILMIRHGQSVANIHQVFAGHTDAELSELGISQAKATAKYIKENYAVDAVYASDLVRAYITGKSVADLFDLPIHSDRNLREIFGGDWEKLSYDDVLERFPKEYTIWLKDVGNAVCVNGESVKELGERIFSELTKIAKENDGKTVVVATHATPVRVMECLTQNRPLDELKDVPWVSNASVTEFIYEAGKWSIEKRGYDEHLADLRSILPPNV